MKNVATIFGKAPRKSRKYKPTEVHWPLPDQLIGLEIEAENTKGSLHPDDLFPYWRRERDGSLRSGHEYVLVQPLKGDPLAKAIQDIFANGVVFHRTATGSTHVHVDMLEEGVTQDTLKALVLLVYVLEPAIFAITDPGREWCGYTNKLTSAPDELVSSILNSNEDNYNDLLALCGDSFRTGRYYGINVLALAKYGSVEFRYFPTATSAEELVEWVKLVQSFKKAAQEVGNVAGVDRLFMSEELYENFLNTYFGQWKDAFMKEIPQWKARSAVHKALAIASSSAFLKNKPIEPFNEDAVWKNKVLVNKFAKKRGERRVSTGGIIWATRDMHAPRADSQPVGTVLIQSDRLYINDGYGTWARDPYRGSGVSGARLTNEVRQSVIAFLSSKTGRWWRDQYTIHGMNGDADVMAVIAQQAVATLRDAIRVEQQMATILEQQRRAAAASAERTSLEFPPPVRRARPQSSPTEWITTSDLVQNTAQVIAAPSNSGITWSQQAEAALTPRQRESQHQSARYLNNPFEEGGL